MLLQQAVLRHYDRVHCRTSTDIRIFELGFDARNEQGRVSPASDRGHDMTSPFCFQDLFKDPVEAVVADAATNC